ncbi:MAG: type I DNA topoisomerase [Rhodovibrionaceae bacterium]|nr:type I DNA topoisomerase [Rhodovibrionaceae bacterium]
MNVVVVESPAKAKTINKYLGDDFRVLASYGHVRDLPPKDGSVRPEDDFAMDWTVDPQGDKRLKEIAQAVKQSDRLYLATDPDREGEAISWHIIEELARRRALKDVDVKRVSFNEITKSAVTEAFANPRELNKELIEAYLARRALDYLVGFTLSPVLWRKLPGSRSAGRVQSVALRLICERESEIEAFRPQEYWTVLARLQTEDGNSFDARLTHLDGKKLGKFDLPDEAAAKRAAGILEEARGFSVEKVETKQVRRNPQPPFTTSTLQQEASRKLGFSATRTMRQAQQLYEGVDIGGETVGLITYMRTDGVQMSREAISAVREMIGSDHGDSYLPDKPRAYSSRAKNAQEAHEAVRPTNFSRRPEALRRVLDGDAFRLYELIWKRAVASQMESARFDQVTADIAAEGSDARLRATGSVLKFDGFLTLYQEGRDDTEDEEEAQRRLPPLNNNQPLQREKVIPEQHFTQPPPRYTEASLVSKLEELGIGRPSTYASIIQVLQDRDYVRLEKKRFVPEDRGRVVVAFLESFFNRYVQYNFTADLEEQLDEISGGRADWKQVLRDFWEAFSGAVEETKDLKISDVIEALDEELGPHFFPHDPKNPDKDPRACPSCDDGRLGLKIGRSGGFIGCSNYPDCTYTRALAAGPETAAEAEAEGGPRALGTDPDTGETVYLKKGPYGFYVQLGEGGKGEKPKRVSLPPNIAPAEITLDQGLQLLALPREVGRHPETGETIAAGIGRYGPYVKHGSTFKSLTPDDDVLHIGLNRAVALLAEAGKQRRGAEPLRTLGEHEGQPVTLHKGRYGPYVRRGDMIASLQKADDPESLDLETAVARLAEKGKKLGAKGRGKRKSGRAKASAGKG